MPKIFCQNCGQSANYSVHKPEKCESCGKHYLSKEPKKKSMSLEEARQLVEAAKRLDQQSLQKAPLKKRITRVSQLERLPEVEEQQESFEKPFSFGSVIVEGERASMTIGDIAGTSEESKVEKRENKDFDKKETLSKLQRESSALDHNRSLK